MSYVGTRYVGERIPSVRQTNVYVGDVSLSFDSTASIKRQYIVTGNTSLALTPASILLGEKKYTGDVNLTLTPNGIVDKEYIITGLINLTLKQKSKGRIEYFTVERLTDMLTSTLTNKIPKNWEEILDG